MPLSDAGVTFSNLTFFVSDIRDWHLTKFKVLKKYLAPKILINFHQNSRFNGSGRKNVDLFFKIILILSTKIKLLRNFLNVTQ